MNPPRIDHRKRPLVSEAEQIEATNEHGDPLAYLWLALYEEGHGQGRLKTRLNRPPETHEKVKVVRDLFVTRSNRRTGRWGILDLPCSLGYGDGLRVRRGALRSFYESRYLVTLHLPEAGWVSIPTRNAWLYIALRRRDEGQAIYRDALRLVGIPDPGMTHEDRDWPTLLDCLDSLIVKPGATYTRELRAVVAEVRAEQRLRGLESRLANAEAELAKARNDRGALLKKAREELPRPLLPVANLILGEAA